MSDKRTAEVLYDSEAALRLVDSAISEFAEGAPAARPTLAPTSASLVDLTSRLASGYAELSGVLSALRQSRSILENSAVNRLSHTHDKLKEVSQATEIAATDILSGLERSATMVDELEALECDAAGAERRAAIRGNLRDELFAAMGHMQFQDITSQQLNYASAVLTDLEARLQQIAHLFDPAGTLGSATDSGEMASGVTFDPNATTKDRDQRQAVADSIVAAARPGL